MHRTCSCRQRTAATVATAATQVAAACNGSRCDPHAPPGCSKMECTHEDAQKYCEVSWQMLLHCYGFQEVA